MRNDPAGGGEELTMPIDHSPLVQLDPATLRCPYPLYERMRREEPVHFMPEIGCYAVTRYDDVLAVLRDPETFSSATPTGPQLAALMEERLAQAMTDSDEMRRLLARQTSHTRTKVLLSADPPLHTRQRNLVNRAFTPRRVAGMDGAIRGVVGQLLDGFAGAGTVEFVRQFAVPLPLTVIADALGVPRDFLPTFKQWSDDAVAPIGNPHMTTERVVEIVRSQVAFSEYFTAKIEERRSEPRDDLITAVVEAAMAGPDPLSVEEVLGMFSQFLVAGNETTTKLLTSAMLILASDAGLCRELAAEHSLIPGFVEEVLRLESPVQGLFRTATADAEVGGVKIPAGSHLWLVYASANRDPAEFPGPERLDVRRPNAKLNLAFGQGPHYCLGAPLARAEARIAFEELLSRLGNFRLRPGQAPLEYEPTFVLHGLKELHVDFDIR